MGIEKVGVGNQDSRVETLVTICSWVLVLRVGGLKVVGKVVVAVCCGGGE